MSLRSCYKGIKKLSAGLKWNRPGILAVDDTALAKVFFPRSEQAVLVAKNLLYVTLDSIKSNNSSSGYTWNGNVVTTNGIEFTISTDSAGFVTEIDVNRVSGTGDAYLRLTDALDTMLTNGKPYIMNGCTGGSINTYTIYTGSAGQWDAPDGDSLVTYNSAWKRIIIKVGIGASPNHVKMYPMIRLATDPDPTYTPYAMTNKQLTDSAADQKTTINAIITAATEAADFAAFKTAMAAITPVTKSLSREAFPEEEPAEVIEEKTTKKITKKK